MHHLIRYSPVIVEHTTAIRACLPRCRPWPPAGRLTPLPAPPPRLPPRLQAALASDRKVARASLAACSYPPPGRACGPALPPLRRAELDLPPIGNRFPS